MRLIKLSANVSSFKTIEFNREGLTLIVGVKTENDEKNNKKTEKTYNGVGKSLMVEILHFCLGSSYKEAFFNAIPLWEFTLMFEIDGIEYSVSRNTSSQNKVFLNNVECSIGKFRNTIQDKIFNIPEGISNLTFRSLLSKFIRSGSKSYNSPDKTVSDYTDYDALIRNAFLLGLDIELIHEKNLLRKQYVETDNLTKIFEKDTVIRNFFKGNLDVDITLKDSYEEINRLEEEQLKFEVAGNYYAIQKEADTLAENIFAQKNRIVVLRNAIANIDVSLKQKPDISREKLVRLYEEVQAAFLPETLKHLEDVERFHADLLENRIARFSRDRLKFLQELEAANSQIAINQQKLDQKLAILGSSRALDQFVAISNQISELKAESQKLKDYKELKQTYSDTLANISTKINIGIIKTNAYLADCQADIERRLSPFRSLSKRFYPRAPAGITLKNNEGNNQLRFDLDVRIQNDASDGVNEVRIFCFDMTLLMARNNHNVRFLVHDSRLFSDIDPRQRATLFRAANELSKAGGFQYIATLNEDQIDSMKEEFTSEELQNFLTENIKVRLKDDSPSSKLLGIQVDMHY